MSVIRIGTDDKAICMFCKNKHLDQNIDEYFCGINNCYVDSELTCDEFEHRKYDFSAYL